MGNIAAVERKTLEGEHLVAPYSPSWVDRFTDWVDHRASPSWMFYVGLWLALYLVEIGIQWTSSVASPFYLFHLYFVGAVPLYLALIHYLDRTADRALNKFRTVLACSDAEYAELRYRLTTLPARPTLLASLIGIVAGIVVLIAFMDGKLQIFHFVDSPASIYYNSAILFTISSVGVILNYHTVHQLRVVSQIYGRARVNLFNLDPLYAFSDLSARTAIGLLAVTYAWYATLPDIPPVGILAVLPTSIVVLTFIWPLLGVHKLLVEEKARLLAECVRRQEVSIAKLHQRIDTDKIEGMDDLNKTMASLEIEHATLSRISTWPWQPEVLRWFVAALLFPVIIWLTQWVLQRFLGP